MVQLWLADCFQKYRDRTNGMSIGQSIYPQNHSVFP